MTQLKLYALFLMFQRFGYTCIGFVYTTRLIEKFGFTNQEVMHLNVFYFAFSVLLELPTGIISDRFGAKKSILLGSLFWFLGEAIYLGGNQYWHFIISEITVACGSAFLSGALDSWIGGHFKCNDKFAEFKRKMNQNIRFISLILTIVLGYLADIISLDIPFYVGTFCFFMTLLISLFFDEKQEISEPMPKFKESIKYYFTNINLFSLGLLCLSNMLWVAPVFMLWGPVIKQDMNLSVSWIGIASCVLSLGMITGGFIEHKYANKITKYSFLTEIVLSIVRGLLIILLGVTVKMNIVFFLIIFFLFEGFIEAGVQFHSIHLLKYYKGRPDEATIASIHSLVMRVGGGLGNLGLGYFADKYSRSYSWYIAGVMMIVTAIIIYTVKLKIEKNSD